MLKYILTDIEGTTTSIDFVHQVLFPYATRHLPDFIRRNHQITEVRKALDEVAQDSKIIHPNLEQMISTLLDWIKTDRKHTALKALQGMLWKEGYLKGDYRGHVYPDVPPALERWKNAGIGLGVYSSGSVEAQILLFKYSEYGDLSPFFSHHFDTRIGHKRETESYEKILQSLELKGETVLFLSDVPEELSAAKAAGMQAIQLLRPGIEANPEFRGVDDFEELEELLVKEGHLNPKNS